MNNYRSINIFVSHPFVPKNKTYDIEKFREQIKLLISKAEEIVKEEYKDFDISTTFIFNDFIQSLPYQIETEIRTSHLGIVDITENKANIFYEYGLLYGLNIPVLVIKAQSSLQDFPIPSDIKNRLIQVYDDFENLIDSCVSELANYFKKLINDESLSSIYLSKIWFPNDVGTIHVIAPPEPEKIESASTESSNYIFLNNIGDVDSVLEVTNFLNRNFRNTNICVYAADEFTKQLDSNLVVIGGPGEEEEEDGNAICAMVTNLMDTKISYCFDDDDEKMDFNGNSYVAEYKGKKVIKDYGYFARFPNPLNPKSSVILIHGIHTFGVLGAAKAFSDHPSAQGNIRTVMKKLQLDDIRQASFECFFPVTVLQQTVVCPDINEDWIFPLEKKK